MSDRDRAILAELNADKIEALRPMTAIPGWQAAFAREADRWRARANGVPATSDTRRDYLAWAFAHDHLVATA